MEIRLEFALSGLEILVESQFEQILIGDIDRLEPADQRGDAEVFVLLRAFCGQAFFLVLVVLRLGDAVQNIFQEFQHTVIPFSAVTKGAGQKETAPIRRLSYVGFCGSIIAKRQ